MDILEVRVRTITISDGEFDSIKRARDTLRCLGALIESERINKLAEDLWQLEQKFYEGATMSVPVEIPTLEISSSVAAEG